VEIATTALDGSTQAIRAKYVIGCDGGRSAVRREAGIALDSAEFDEPWVVVDAKARCGGKDPSLPPHHFQVCDPKQPVTYVPMTGPYYEWQFMVVDGKSEREATDPAYVRSQLRNFVDPDQIEIIRIAYYNFHALWARTWRNGRIVLAGDSAHQMPPFLGQGMCSGVRDAMSLAWRLDLILAGKTDERVLQHYEDERAKHVRHIIEGAMFLGNVIQTRKPAVAAARNVFAFFLPSVLAPMREAFTALANRKRPIECGFIGKTTPKLAGTFLPQPRVATMKGEALLDDVLGRGSVVLCRAPALSKVRGAVLASGLELRSFGFERSPAEGVVGDASGALEHWFQRAGVDLVVVRPDRVVFDGGSLRELPRLLKAFGAPFLQHSSVARAA
jgi:3-(3-hydroxy-phenyl)propionate hydroxylase